ncbi:hypothetical protein [Polyangium aurulentum]|uniref:hypothetical protein n=1 Tax=Polyangium aurulentum TaxID=2567896 RepID=UPI0010AE2E74|nr:hypothetical protein [Polyangium aurulentum]UQA55973.1 hypothetical protein E8A73_032240 [Polyangium aurulentum]
MRNHLLLLVASAALIGCEPPPLPPRSAARSCPSAIVQGHPSQISLVSSADGVSFDPPKTCQGLYPDAPEYYIRVHGHGTRRLDYSQREPNECDVPDADPVACPKVHFSAFAKAMLPRLTGLGLGACADASAPLDQWNISPRINDFRHADEALRIIDAELRRWNIGDDWGLSIIGIPCVSPL